MANELTTPFDPRDHLLEQLHEAIVSYQVARDVLPTGDTRLLGARKAFLARFPDVAPALRAYFENEDAVENCLAPLGPDVLCSSEQRPEIVGLEVGEKIGAGGMGVVYKATQI